MDQDIIAAAQYAAVRLPHKPRLAPWLILVDLGENRLQLRSANSTFTLGHRFLIDIFYMLYPLLDGRHTVEEIADRGAEGVLPTTAVFLLKMLAANGLLQEAESLEPSDPDDRARWERQLRFLGHYVPDATHVQVTLQKSGVAVLGSPALQVAVRAAIKSLGVERVEVIELPSQDANGPDRPEYWLTPPVGVDILVACLESPSFSAFEQINAVCLKSGLRWLRVAMEGTRALLGPTIVPYQTACFTCYKHRVQAHVEDLEGFKAYHERISDTSSIPDEGAFGPLWSVLAGQAALEVARILTGFAAPVTIGRFFELDASSPEAIGHDVLRLPMCPSCGSRVPSREPWDLPLSVTDITDDRT